jgi:hypothetical protein
MGNANSLLTNVVLSDFLRFGKPTPENIPRFTLSRLAVTA